MYQTEYPFLDYLNHIMTECEDALKIENGCPLDKCKVKDVTMTLNDLRKHLVDDCNKVTMECNVCLQ